MEGLNMNEIKQIDNFTNFNEIKKFCNAMYTHHHIIMTSSKYNLKNDEM